jgi:hypothetical protein
MSKAVPLRKGIGISMKHPPGLRSEALAQITACPGAWISTEIEHFTRGHRRRSVLGWASAFSVSSWGTGKSHNALPGLRFTRPITPSVAVPGVPIHFTRKCPLFLP